MKKLIKMFLPALLVAVFASAASVPPQSASALGYMCPCLIAYGYDLTGDGINDIVYDDGYDNIYIQSSNGYKYRSYSIPNRTSLSVANNVDGNPGNDIVVTDVWNHLYVIGVNTYEDYNLNGYSNYGTRYLQYNELDGYPGNEIVITFGSAIHVLVLIPRNYSAQFFPASSNYTYKAAFTFVESDGDPGNEMLLMTNEGYAYIFDTRDRVSRVYWIGTGWINIEFVDLDGVAGKEIVFNWTTNQARVRDRTYSYY